MTEIMSNHQIYQILEDEIVSLRIPPGEILSENKLCDRFHVSRTPVRSVLQRLQQKRFVTIIPHQGTIVTPIDLDIVTQMIYQRVAVETMVLRDFIRIATPTDIARVHYQYQRMEEIAKQEYPAEDFDGNDFLKRDLQMHQVWFDTCSKSYLWDLLTAPHADYSRFIRLDIVGAQNVSEVMENHREMLRLIDDKCENGIEELMSSHLYGGVRRLGGQLFSEEYKKYFQAAVK